MGTAARRGRGGGVSPLFALRLLVLTPRRPTTWELRGPRSGIGHRAGLATLEFVLCLPVLLFVMALMVVSESKMCWKIRGDITARDAAWRSRWRSGGNLPNPQNWPPPATMSAAGTPPNSLLDLPTLQQPVVRGPQFMTFQVDSTKFDNTLGGWLGQSHRNWTPPLLPKLGAASLDSRHLIWDTEWQYWQMGIPWNTYRRIPYLYQLPQPDPSFAMAYFAALGAIVGSPSAPALAVLDRDEEIRAWYGNYHDFHPRVPGFCNANRSQVASNQVQTLINQIQGGNPPRPINGVPGNMGRFFRGMYQQQRNQPMVSLLNQFLQMLQ